jgi:hypothetical protein
MKILRETTLALGLLVSGSFVIWGIAGWSENVARVVAGVLVAVFCVLFLAEVSD